MREFRAITVNSKIEPVTITETRKAVMRELKQITVKQGLIVAAESSATEAVLKASAAVLNNETSAAFAIEEMQRALFREFEQITVNQPNLIIITDNGTYNVSSKTRAIINVNNKGIPIEVGTAAEMKNILDTATSADNGKVYKYVGDTTSSYDKNAYYVLEV